MIENNKCKNLVIYGSFAAALQRKSAAALAQKQEQI
jgi:hypothetical protein